MSRSSVPRRGVAAMSMVMSMVMVGSGLGATATAPGGILWDVDDVAAGSADQVSACSGSTV
ncbi:hypothetical protein [Nesterenkonia marinintestina]|uniref:hypothetical protein n=1 Tax=Nesterenkonia marinintestina TaxID=2979865 RepID=UPI0021BE278E|nr:hypothetical protein [Nesterenkonia sp. GX14115]